LEFIVKVFSVDKAECMLGLYRKDVIK